MMASALTGMCFIDHADVLLTGKESGKIGCRVQLPVIPGRFCDHITRLDYMNRG